MSGQRVFAGVVVWLTSSETTQAPHGMGMAADHYS